MSSFTQLADSISQFAAEREWDRFHSPKNLAMDLSVEASELPEHFQWLTEHESLNLSASQHEQVALEMADVFIYLLRLADKLDIDLLEIARRKIVLNEQKYPAEKVRGKAGKRNDR